MFDGKPQRDISIYSILVLRLNHLLSHCGPATFQVVEPVLLRWVLSASPLASSLATDVLCFLVRVSPPEIGWNLTLAMAHLFQRLVKGREGLRQRSAKGGKVCTTSAPSGLEVSEVVLGDGRMGRGHGGRRWVGVRIRGRGKYGCEVVKEVVILYLHF